MPRLCHAGPRPAWRSPQSPRPCWRSRRPGSRPGSRATPWRARPRPRATCAGPADWIRCRSSRTSSQAKIAPTPAAALEPLRKAAAKEPRSVDARFELALGYLRAHRLTAARRELRLALRLEPGAPRDRTGAQPRRNTASRLAPVAGKALITGGAGFIGSHLSNCCSRTAGRSSSSTTCPPGQLAQHRAPALAERLPPRRRLDPLARGRERGRAQVRRRLPPRRGGRRPPDRRAARPHDGHERPGHRDRARVLQQVRQARAGRLQLRGLRRPPRGAAARGGRPARSTGRRPRSAGSTPTRRRWTSTSRSRTTSSAGSTRWSCGSSTPSARGRAAATGW